MRKGIPEKNETPERTKNTENIRMFMIKVNMEVRFEAATMIHFGKFILEISDDLYCIEAIPLLVDSAK